MRTPLEQTKFQQVIEKNVTNGLGFYDPWMDEMREKLTDAGASEQISQHGLQRHLEGMGVRVSMFENLTANYWKYMDLVYDLRELEQKTR